MRSTVTNLVCVLMLLLGVVSAERTSAAQSEPDSWPPPRSRLLEFEPISSELQLGTSTRLALRFRDLPPNSGVVVRLIRAGGRDAVTESRYLGELGPIHDQALQLSGSGQAVLLWDGRTVGCSPEDAPVRCEIEPGRYRYEAAVYPRSDFAVVPFLGSRPQPLPIAFSYSEPFVVRGHPNLKALATVLKIAASKEVGALPSSQSYWMMGRSDLFVDEGKNLRAEARGWCMDFKPRPPLQGDLTACAPTSVISTEGLQVRGIEFSFHGQPRWPANVIEGRMAWNEALALVPSAQQLGYAGWPPGATGRQKSINASIYRPDLKGWLVAVLSVRDGAPEMVIIFINDVGHACIAQQGPVYDLTPSRLETDRPSC